MADTALKRPSRRAFLLAAGSASLLSACGSGTIASQFNPARIVAFGDGFSDLGQNGSSYTVNDGLIDNWTAQVASSYGLPLSPQVLGGNSYAQGNARISGTPDAAGGSTPSITQQIDKFLSSNSFSSTDLVLINGGLSDMVYEMAAVSSNAETQPQMLANLTKAGTDFANQIQRLVLAGAKYITVIGTYDLSKSPWAALLNQSSVLTQGCTAFNNALLLGIVNLGKNVLYVDAAYYFNLLTATPTTYGLIDSTTVVCNSVSPSNAIGIGLNQVDSALCTQNTITSGLDYTKYVFADPVYFTPAAQVLFGNYAFTKLRGRW